MHTKPFARRENKRLINYFCLRTRACECKLIKFIIKQLNRHLRDVYFTSSCRYKSLFNFIPFIKLYMAGNVYAEHWELSFQLILRALTLIFAVCNLTSFPIRTRWLIYVASHNCQLNDDACGLNFLRFRRSFNER